MCKGRLIEFSIYSLSVCGQRRQWRYQLKKKIREFWESHDTPHTLTHRGAHARTPTHPGMLHGAVLILVTAQGLTTRDSTGSNQRKPDFFSAHKGTDYLLYQILHSGWGCEEKSLFQNKQQQQKRCGSP